MRAQTRSMVLVVPCLFGLPSSVGADLKFDADKSWDEKREIWRISGKFVRTTSVTQTALGDKDGRWTTAIAAAILIP